MIKVKHFMAPIEQDDGLRIWVEPIGLTTDLREWCKVDKVLPHLGPQKHIWAWFDDHPDAWEEFRGRYHEELSHSRYLPALLKLARCAMKENYTLVYQGDHPTENTAEALAEFIHELEAYVPRED